MNTFSFVGYLKPIKDSETRKNFEIKTYDSGWISERLRFRVIAGDNAHFVEINAGRWDQESKNTIYGFTKKENDKKGKLIRQERFAGAMQRTFYVGKELNTEDIKAKFENGMLNIVLPSKEQKSIESKQVVTIE